MDGMSFSDHGKLYWGLTRNALFEWTQQRRS